MQTPLSIVLVVLAILFGLMMLTACGMTTGTATTGDGSVRACCLAFEPLSYSAAHDTPESVLGIRRFNAAYAALCSDDPQP